MKADFSNFLDTFVTHKYIMVWILVVLIYIHERYRFSIKRSLIRTVTAGTLIYAIASFTPDNLIQSILLLIIVTVGLVCGFTFVLAIFYSILDLIDGDGEISAYRMILSIGTIIGIIIACAYYF